MVGFKEATNVGKDLLLLKKTVFQILDLYSRADRKTLGTLWGFVKSINFPTWMFQRSGITKQSLYLNSFKVNTNLHLQTSVHWIKMPHY